MKYKLMAALVALPLALSACQTTGGGGDDLMSQGWFPMKADQIKTMLTSNTMEGSGWATYHPSATSITMIKGDKTVSGTWTAKDGEFCRTYDKGSETCYNIHRRGSEVRFPNGSVAVVKKGNTKGL